MAALDAVALPGSSAGLVGAGEVIKASACDGHVLVRLRAREAPDQSARAGLATRAAGEIRARFARDGLAFTAAVIEFADEQGATIEALTFRAEGAPGHQPIGGLKSGGAMPGVRHAIAVGAGKGGVGKSTIAVNLAVGLARRGLATGLLDADIYGPSAPTMLGLGALEAVVHSGRLQPFLVHGVKAMTLGKLVEPDKPLIWRGPMAHGAFRQLLEQTAWGELDRLVIDLPPGTGDVPLTMTQSIRLGGAVIVCTPQRVAQDDAVRATRMFQHLGVEVLGVVENMSYFVGDDGKEYDLFGRGGAERMASRLNLPFLGALPISTGLRRRCDEGDPSGNFRDEALAGALDAIVSRVEEELAVAAVRQGALRPELTIS